MNQNKTSRSFILKQNQLIASGYLVNLSRDNLSMKTLWPVV